MDTDFNNLKDKQLKLFTILTPLQQKMCIYMEKGSPPVEAYRLAGGKAESANSMQACAYSLLQNSNVRAFRESLNSETLNGMIMSRAEMRARLTAIARGNITDLVRIEQKFIGYDEETGEERFTPIVIYEPFETANPDALAALAEISRNEHGIKLKMHSPTAAIKQLAELDGLNAPTKQDIKVSGGAVVSITTVDPAEAAKQYMDLMK